MNPGVHLVTGASLPVPSAPGDNQRNTTLSPYPGRGDPPTRETGPGAHASCAKAVNRLRKAATYSVEPSGCDICCCGLMRSGRFRSGVRVAPGSRPGGAGPLTEAPARVQAGLTQAPRGDGALPALVVGAEPQRLLQAEQPRRHQPLELLPGRLADVGDLALAGDVDVHVVGAGILPHDHPLVHLGA